MPDFESRIAAQSPSAHTPGQLGISRFPSTISFPFSFGHGSAASKGFGALPAVQMSVFVVRAFLKMRALLGDKRDLAQKLASLEKELKKRLDVHEAVIVTILQRVMDIIDPPALPAPPPKPRIGFNP